MKLFFPITAAVFAVSFASAQGPVIKAIVPQSAAAGFGQLVTLQGFGLDLINNPVINFQPVLGGATIHCSFNIPVASNTNELYIRRASNSPSCVVPVDNYNVVIPAGFSPGTVLVQLKTSIGVATSRPSNALKLQIVP